MVKLTDCLITEDENDLIFEWWNDPKKLTIYLNKKFFKVDYIQVWGSDMQNEMQEGSIKSISTLYAVFAWLNKLSP